MKKEKTSTPHLAQNSSDNSFDIDINACSATDCTGLIPSLPQSEAELESYEDIYHYQPPTLPYEKP